MPYFAHLNTVPPPTPTCTNGQPYALTSVILSASDTTPKDLNNPGQKP
jgi:hypothetical protein